MNIKIDSEMKAKHSKTRLGCIKYTTSVDDTNAELWNIIENEVIPDILKSMETTSINEFNNVAHSREAYKAFGKDPNRYRVSSEALYRRIKQGKGIYKINTVVDTNNLISIETGFSVGSYDLANVADEITLRIGSQGESYKGIGKDNVNVEHLPVLCDSKGPFGSPTSDSTRAMITSSSKEVLTVIYDFSSDSNIEKLLEDASQKFIKYAKAENIETFVID